MKNNNLKKKLQFATALTSIVLGALGLLNFAIIWIGIGGINPGDSLITSSVFVGVGCLALVVFGALFLNEKFATTPFVAILLAATALASVSFFGFLLTTNFTQVALAVVNVGWLTAYLFQTFGKETTPEHSA